MCIICHFHNSVAHSSTDTGFDKNENYSIAFGASNSNFVELLLSDGREQKNT